MPRVIRPNPARDENTAPAANDCIAHRCAEHSNVPPLNDTGDDGSECAICVAIHIGGNFVTAHEEAAEKYILDKLFWPMVETARDRMNLLSPGTGTQFEEHARHHVTEFSSIFAKPTPTT